MTHRIALDELVLRQIMTHRIALDELVLRQGSHTTREKGVCLLEAVAWWAGEAHSGRPTCVSPALAAFGIGWNDGMRSDDEREQLKPYIPLLVGTAGDPEADKRRAWMALDWLVRTYAPAWLRAAGLGEHAETLATLRPLTDSECATAALPVTKAARDAARGAAWDAAGDAAVAAVGAAAVAAVWAAAGGAAWDAAGVAARATVWDAARATAWGAARGGAWDAAGDAAVAAAGDAAWAATVATVGAAVWAAAGDAAGGAGATAWDAAGDATVAATVATVGATVGDVLEPTVRELQDSAHELYRAMIAVGSAQSA